MSRPRNSSKPISEAKDKLLAAIVGESLSHRPELWDIMARSKYFRELIEDERDDDGRMKDLLDELEKRFSEMAKQSLHDGDAGFFRDAAGMVDMLSAGLPALPIDRFLLELKSWPKEAIPRGFFSAAEVFDMLGKRDIQCGDIKIVRDAAKRVGIELRRESPGRKKQLKK